MAKVLKAASVLKPNGEKEIIYDSSSLLAERVTAVENRPHIVGELDTTTTDAVGNTQTVYCRWYNNGWMEQWGFAGNGVTYVLPFSAVPRVCVTAVDSNTEFAIVIRSVTETGLIVAGRYVATHEVVPTVGFTYYVCGWKA